MAERGWGVGKPSASTQHCYRGGRRAQAQLWVAATARHCAPQWKEISLHSVEGTRPLAAVLCWLLGGLFGIFWSQKRQREVAATPSSLLNHVCLGHCLTAPSYNGKLSLCPSQLDPRACKHPNHRGEHPHCGASLLCPCLVPCKQGGGLQEEGGCQHSMMCFVTWKFLFPIYKESLGLFLKDSSMRYSPNKLASTH